jgi:amino acid permease
MVQTSEEQLTVEHDRQQTPQKQQRQAFSGAIMVFILYIVYYIYKKKTKLYNGRTIMVQGKGNNIWSK